MRAIAAACLAATSLCGCETRGGAVVAQTAPSPGPPAVSTPASPLAASPQQFLRPLPRPHLSPCTAPQGTGPYERPAKPIHSPHVAVPSRALAEQVWGCAGVRFHIGPDGRPRDIELVKEYPPDYGFGATGMNVVGGSAWAPRADTAWQYLLINISPIRS